MQGTRTVSARLDGTTLYTTTFPCLPCANKIVSAKIKEVVYVEPYPIKEAAEVLESAGVRTRRFEGVKAQAFFKLFKTVPS